MERFSRPAEYGGMLLFFLGFFLQFGGSTPNAYYMRTDRLFYNTIMILENSILGIYNNLYGAKQFLAIYFKTLTNQ